MVWIVTLISISGVACIQIQDRTIPVNFNHLRINRVASFCTAKFGSEQLEEEKRIRISARVPACFSSLQDKRQIRENVQPHVPRSINFTKLDEMTVQTKNPKSETEISHCGQG